MGQYFLKVERKVLKRRPALAYRLCSAEKHNNLSISRKACRRILQTPITPKAPESPQHDLLPLGAPPLDG
jgi:hypothetical protein